MNEGGGLVVVVVVVLLQDDATMRWLVAAPQCFTFGTAAAVL